MEQGFIDILKKLVAKQGPGALIDAGKCKAFLADYAGSGYKKERRLLVLAVEVGVAKAIAGARDLASCKKAQVRELEEQGLATAAAEGIVDALALVLRGDTNRAQAKPKAPPAAASTARAGQAPAAATSNVSRSSTDTFLERGIMFAMRGDYGLAIEEFTEAIKVNAEMTAAYILRGRALYASVSEIIVVEGKFDHVGAIAPKKASVERDVAYDKAIRDYDRAIALSPNKTEAYIGRGDAYSGKGDFHSAIKDYNRAIRLEPNSALAYIHRGDTYCTKGEYDQAIADYNQAIRLEPDYAYAYTGRGNAYYGKREFNLAVDNYTKAISLDPNYVYAYAWRGNAQENIDFRLATEDYLKAYELDPNNQLAIKGARKVGAIGWH